MAERWRCPDAQPGRSRGRIPGYNTSGACVDVIEKARAAADAVLVVDDGSTDDTPDHIRRTGIVCFRLEHNAGKGAALKAGIQEVLKGRRGLLGDVFDYVLTVDGDGQHDPSTFHVSSRWPCASAPIS